VQDDDNDSGNRGEGWFEVPSHDDKDFDTKVGPLFDRLGRPKDAAGYAFDDPPDFEFSDSDKEYRESFKPIAHRLGLTARQAKGLAEWQIAQAKVVRDAERAGRDEGGKKARAALQKEWGRDFDGRIKSANEAFKHYAGRDASALARLQLADGSLLADRIEFVRLMHSIGSAAPAPKKAGSAEDAIEQIKEIQEAAVRQGLDPTHRNWPHRQLERLYAEAYGDEPLDQSGAQNSNRRRPNERD
jgi:hypothetical protein